METAEPERPASLCRFIGEHVGLLGQLELRSLQRRVARRASLIATATAEIDAVYLVFNEFKSVIAQRLVVEQILPIAEIGEHEMLRPKNMTTEQRERAAEAALKRRRRSQKPMTRSEIDEEASKFGTAQVDYIYEQPPAELFAALLPKYVADADFPRDAGVVAAEHAARMTAMESATNNASDMIDSLTLTMNRARQAAITKEIIEIVSGAAALITSFKFRVSGFNNSKRTLEKFSD